MSSRRGTHKSFRRQDDAHVRAYSPPRREARHGKAASRSRGRSTATSTARRPRGARQRHGSTGPASSEDDEEGWVDDAGDAMGIVLTYDGIDLEDPLAGTVDERLVWTLEKCRQLERRRISQLEQNDKLRQETKEARKEVKQYRASNMEMKKLVAQLCIKLRTAEATAEQADTRVEKARASVQTMRAQCEAMQNEVKQVTARASSQHAMFLRMTREAEVMKLKSEETTLAFETRLSLQREDAIARYERLTRKMEAREAAAQDALSAKEDAEAAQRELQNTVERERRRVANLLEQLERERAEADKRVQDLKDSMADNDERAKNAVAHAARVEATFALKDQQVAEFAQLVEQWEGERSELHRVLRQFEAKDEEQSMSILALRKQLHVLQSENREMRRARNLEHMASVDMERKVKETLAGSPRAVVQSPAAAVAAAVRSSPHPWADDP